jgi:hypothetical protein
MNTERADEIRSFPGIIRRGLGLLAAIGLDRELWVICNIRRESPFAVDSCPALEVEDPEIRRDKGIHGNFPGSASSRVL